jgi:hypothetical protein
VSYLDFAEIKKNTNIEDLISTLGLEMRQKGNQWRGKCPVSNEGGDRALVITPAKQAWYSFGAKKGGDVIALVEFINGVSTKEAAQFLSTVPEEKEARPAKSKASEVKGFKELEYLEADHDAVVALGFESEDAERLGIGYAKRGVMRGSIAVPVRLSDGTLVGYLGVKEAILPASWRF